jgi:hypothetical protein
MNCGENKETRIKTQESRNKKKTYKRLHECMVTWMDEKITNFKHQITKKLQNPNLKFQT